MANLKSYNEYHKLLNFGLLTEAELSDADKKKGIEAASGDFARSTAVIMGRYKFFGELVFKLRTKYVYDPRIKTMATDGKHIFVSPTFCASLTDKQITFVICHEIMHNVMGHFVRQQNRDPELWNIAADLEINPLLVDEALISKDELKNQMHGLYEDRFLGKSAEVIYDELLEENKAMKDLLDKLKKQFKDKNFGEVMTPQEGKQVAQQNGVDEGDGEEGEGEGEGEGEEKDGEGKGTGSGSGGKEGEGEEKEGKGKGKGKEEMSDEAKEAEAKKKWQESANQAASKAGSGMGNMLRVKILNLTKSKVDWKKELKKYIGKALSKSVYKLPARRHLHRGIYLHAAKRKYDALDSIAVAIDTSGSINEKQVHKFLSEVKTIIASKKPQETYIVYFDHGVQGVDQLKKTKQEFDLSQAKGGGGTDFVPPLRWVEDNIIKKGKQLELFVFFTDGFANLDIKKPEYADRFIWVIIEDPAKRIKLPWGTRIDIDTKDLSDD